MVKRIISKENKIIKRIKALQQKKYRDKDDYFIAEGERFISELPNKQDIEEVVISDSFSADNAADKYERVYVVPNNLFSELADTENPQGILAVCKKAGHDIYEVLNAPAPFFIIGEEINDPGNLGTIIRTAAAAGATAVFLSKGSADVYNPKTLRSTMGAVFHIPVFQNIDIAEIRDEMKKRGISLYAAHLKGEHFPYDLPLTLGCAFLIGNEARGLSDKSTALCDSLVKIPMPGHGESLNASVAAGILIYETVRQRL